MKLAILAVCLLGFMLLECHSSPVQLVENHELVEKARALGRQAAAGDVAPAAPAAAATDDDEDDDEDDDDDEPDLGDLVDDDDDDDDDDEEDDDDDEDDDEDDTPQGQAAPGATSSDDDEEDDDDDDYLDRIFDDILGDDDDDDDDDEDEPSPAAAAPAPAAAAAAPAVPAAPAAPAVPVAQPAAVANQVQADAGEIVEEAASSASEAENTIATAADEVAEGEQNVFYDEENTGIDTKVDIQSLNNKPLESTTAKVSVAAAPAAANEVESSDDDDDDDEDDITGALTGDDDDEDDDDTDDDDDDDDIVGDDVIEARRARGGAAEKNVVIEMPKDAFQDRHNQFIDAIFARINRIVSDSYDPFKVRLATTPKQAIKAKLSATAAAGATKANKKSKTKKVAAGTKARSTDASDSANDSGVADVKSESVVEQKPQPAVPVSSPASTRTKQPTKPQSAGNANVETAEQRTVPSSSGLKNRKKVQPLRATSAAAGNTNKQTSKQKLKQNSSPSSAAANSISAGNGAQKLHRAEGTLSGLASLRRVGNAKVVTDPEGRNSTIKSKFTLGPLTLKVEKSFKRGNVRNVKTATARTNEMIGRIKFSVVNDQATLVSIKVQQPKQVEVESKDNHDRTREFVWRRTPKIARLVSEKLKLAAESLFQPTAGVEVVRL